MGVVAVHAAVGEQAHQMQGACRFSMRFPLAATQRGVLKEIAVCNGLGDAGQFLIHHAAGADVGVADLGVAHLSIRQADIHAGSADLGDAGCCRRQRSRFGVVGRLDGIAVIAG